MDNTDEMDLVVHRNKLASERFIGRLFQSHPEHAPQVKRVKDTVDEPPGACVHYIPTKDTLTARIGRLKPKGKAIISEVARFYDLTIPEITGDCRALNIVRPRQIAMYFAVKHGGMSLSAFGRLINKDHSTVQHGVKAISELLKTNARVQDEVAVLMLRLLGEREAA